MKDFKKTNFTEARAVSEVKLLIATHEESL